VNTLRSKHFKAGIRVCQRFGFFGPDPGGVNNVLGFDREFLSAFKIGQSRTYHLARGVFINTHHLGT